MIAELDVECYELISWKSVDEAVKQFDPAFVITVDGRKPVDELFATVRARLSTMPLQRTVLPEVVPRDEQEVVMDESALLDDYAYRYGWNGEFGEEFDAESTQNDPARAVNESTTGNGQDAVRKHHEDLRMTSEFGGLCPVSFKNDSFKMGSGDYRVKFMGKTFRTSARPF